MEWSAGPPRTRPLILSTRAGSPATDRMFVRVRRGRPCWPTTGARISAGVLGTFEAYALSHPIERPSGRALFDRAPTYVPAATGIEQVRDCVADGLSAACPALFTLD